MHIVKRMNKRGDVRYYWYRSVRQGKTVISQYIRPATDEEIKEHLKCQVKK